MRRLTRDPNPPSDLVADPLAGGRPIEGGDDGAVTPKNPNPEHLPNSTPGSGVRPRRSAAFLLPFRRRGTAP